MAKFRSNNTWEQQRFYWEAHDAMRRQAQREGLGLTGEGVGTLLVLILVGAILFAVGPQVFVSVSLPILAVLGVFAIALTISGLILLILNIKDKISMKKTQLNKAKSDRSQAIAQTHEEHSS